MNRDEEFVRRALHHHADGIEPGDGSQERIQQRVHEARRRRRLGWAGGATGAVAAAVLLVVAVATLGGNGARVVETGPAAPAVPSTAPEPPPSGQPQAPPSATCPPVDAGGPTLVPGVWPFHTVAELGRYLDSGDTRYDDAVEVARSFAVDYLGMADPVVGQPTGPGPDGTLDVVVQPRGEGGGPLGSGIMETVVHLDPQGPPWQVLFATSSELRLDGDSFRNMVGSPIAISGAATAYEGTVQVEVRQAGMEAGDALGRDVITAGAQGDLRPFAAEVAFERPDTEGFGALVLFTESAVDGSTLAATTAGLYFEAASTPTTLPDQTEVTAFFLRGEELFPVTRSVPATSGVLRASLEQLLAGPTDGERSAGVLSLFAAEACGQPFGVTIDGDGKVVVDFGPGVVNGSAGTSTGSTLLLKQLSATVFQFPTVESVEYRLGGSCDAFFEWLQRGCEVIERPGG